MAGAARPGSTRWNGRSGWRGRGAGEILLTSMDRDGTKSGFDTALTARGSRARRAVPIIASGGVGEAAHFVEGARAGATGLLAASVFHYGTMRIADAKAALAAAGLPVRPVMATASAPAGA